ncbi:MAG: mandelate racemase [Nocardioidaceae bacterium]|nr:mandelate racemase [Nocardioidaceae bacterium]
MTVTDAAIDSVATAVYTVPTDAPEADGTFTWDATTLVMVTLRAAGVVGTGWTYGAPACAAVVRDHLAPIVQGRSALDVAEAWEQMVRALRNVGRPGMGGMALSAVDIAMWDLKARLLDLPLHRLLGAVHDGVPLYGSGGFTTYDDARLDEQLTGWVRRDGIPRVKIKIGESWGTQVDRDLDRVRKARAAIGDETQLYVDANGGYSVGQALRVARQLRDSDVRWFEEPITSDDLDGLRHLRRLTSMDITAGEYGYDLTYFRRMCAAGAVDCLQIDVTRCGGITELPRVSAVAAPHGLDVSGHCAPHLHVAALAAIPNLRHLEWFHDHVRIEAMLFDGTLDPSGGDLRPAEDRLGHGLALRPDRAEPFRIA